MESGLTPAKVDVVYKVLPSADVGQGQTKASPETYQEEK
jgi:hypothetical protein